MTAHGLRKRPGITPDNISAWNTASHYTVSRCGVLVLEKWADSKNADLQWTGLNGCIVASEVGRAQIRNSCHCYRRCDILQHDLGSRTGPGQVRCSSRVANTELMAQVQSVWASDTNGRFLHDPWVCLHLTRGTHELRCAQIYFASICVDKRRSSCVNETRPRDYA